MKYINQKILSLILLVAGSQMASAQVQNCLNYEELIDTELVFAYPAIYPPIDPDECIIVESICDNSKIASGLGDDNINVMSATIDSEFYTSGGNDTIFINNPVNVHIDAGLGDDEVNLIYSGVISRFGINDPDLELFLPNTVHLGEGDNDVLFINVASTNFRIINDARNNETRIYLKKELNRGRLGLDLFLRITGCEFIEFSDVVRVIEYAEPTTTRGRGCGRSRGRG